MRSSHGHSPALRQRGGPTQQPTLEEIKSEKKLQLKRSPSDILAEIAAWESGIDKLYPEGSEARQAVDAELTKLRALLAEIKALAA